MLARNSNAIATFMSMFDVLFHSEKITAQNSQKFSAHFFTFLTNQRVDG